MELLQHIKAIPNPGGNSVELQWLNLKPGKYSGVAVRRSKHGYPASPSQGQPVKPKEGGDNKNNLLATLDGTFAKGLDNKRISPKLAAELSKHHIVIPPQAIVSPVKTGVWKIIAKEASGTIIHDNFGHVTLVR
ncbi:MAG: hypothetical protein GY757_22915 [bacterium]|nr:hypothetical protein [bacterium]